MFERAHHQRIAHVLAALDGEVLRAHHCWFGGGTCIALRFGEYRESVDIDFLVSDAAGYRELRQLLTGPQGLAPITKSGAMPLVLAREVRADQYGIRTLVQMDRHAIKFEIVREARLALSPPWLKTWCVALAPSRCWILRQASCWPIRIDKPTTGCSAATCWIWP